METKVKDKLEADFTTVSSACDLSAALEATIDGSKWRLAMETKDLRTAIAADFSERFDFELMCTPPRFLNMKITYACSSTDYKISSTSGAIFEGVSYDKAYRILGLIDCEPEIVAYSGPT